MDPSEISNRRASATLSASDQTGSAGEAAATQAHTSQFHFRHIPELDGFRGVSILLVFVGHIVEYRAAGVRSYALATSCGSLGVLLFFVLSGFLITGLLHRERSTTGKIDFRRFYVRRVLRLGPAFFLFLLTVVILMCFGLVTDVPRKEIIECLLYARNIFGRSLTLGHIWSLSLEEQFYLLWPFVFSILALRRSANIVTIICLSIATWRTAAIATHLFSYESGIYSRRPYFRFDSILIGACLVLWLASSPRALVLGRKLLSIVPPVVLWGALLCWTALGEDLTHALYLSIQEILVAIVLAQLVLCNYTKYAAIFRSGALRYLGTISYSLYLWQQLFLVTSVPSWGPLREFPLCVVVPVAIAAASNHWIEKPVLGLKNRLAPQSLPK
jgi:peptidoglycan/LPS O-acetylase OafA/YrhL